MHVAATDLPAAESEVAADAEAADAEAAPAHAEFEALSSDEEAAADKEAAEMEAAVKAAEQADAAADATTNVVAEQEAAGAMDEDFEIETPRLAADEPGPPRARTDEQKLTDLIEATRGGTPPATAADGAGATEASDPAAAEEAAAKAAVSHAKRRPGWTQEQERELQGYLGACVDVPEPFPYREICSKMGILYGIGYGMSYEDDELEDEFAASDAESRSGESSLEGAEALEVSIHAAEAVLAQTEAAEVGEPAARPPTPCGSEVAGFSDPRDASVAASPTPTRKAPTPAIGGSPPAPPSAASKYLVAAPAAEPAAAPVATAPPAPASKKKSGACTVL